MMEKEMILKLYNNYMEEDYKTSKRHQELSIKFNEKLKEFCDTLKATDKKKFDNIINLAFEMNGESEKQVFIDGYSMGVKLTIEALYEKKEK